MNPMQQQPAFFIARCCLVRHPCEAPRTEDRIFLPDGRTLIVSYTRRLPGMDVDSIFYRVRHGDSPISPLWSVTLRGWTRLTTGGICTHHAGDSELCNVCASQLVHVAGPDVTGKVCPQCDADSSVLFEEADGL